MKRICLYMMAALLTLTACNQTLEDVVEYEAIRSELEVSTSELVFQSTGQSQTVLITCNSYWKATASASWLGLSNKSGKGNGLLAVQADANASTTSSRSGDIQITDGIKTIVVNVTQEPSRIDKTVNKPGEGDNPTPSY